MPGKSEGKKQGTFENFVFRLLSLNTLPKPASLDVLVLLLLLDNSLQWAMQRWRTLDTCRRLLSRSGSSPNKILDPAKNVLVNSRTSEAFLRFSRPAISTSPTLLAKPSARCILSQRYSRSSPAIINRYIKRRLERPCAYRCECSFERWYSLSSPVRSIYKRHFIDSPARRRLFISPD